MTKQMLSGKALTATVLVFVIVTALDSKADQVQDGPRFDLFGGASTSHPFTNFPQVVGTVTVEVQCKADLGCHPWDFTDCNTGSGLCDVDPEDKWVRVTIAGEVIEGTDSFVGVPNMGEKRGHSTF